MLKDIPKTKFLEQEQNLNLTKLTVQETRLECTQQDQLQALGRVEQGRGRGSKQVYPAQVLNIVQEH